MLTTVYLAAEDELGLAVGRKLISCTEPLTVWRADNMHGCGNLRNRVPSFQEMGRFMPVLMLTDLDKARCPSKLIKEWLGAAKPSAGFFFRICVQEVEAWLMAHREAMSDFLHLPISRIPSDPETLSSPKEQLIRLAQKSPKKIRKGLTPIGSAPIGPDYNLLLSEFVRDSWNISIAAKSAPSLARAFCRVKSLAEKQMDTVGQPQLMAKVRSQ